MKTRSCRGLTLLELIIVLVIITVLALLSIGYLQRWVEKTRASEAKNMLIQIRTAYRNYMMEHKNTPQTLDDLGVEENLTICNGDRYFYYSINATYARATRCTQKSKAPRARNPYQISINLLNSTWTGTAGYY